MPRAVTLLYTWPGNWCSQNVGNVNYVLHYYICTIFSQIWLYTHQIRTCCKKVIGILQGSIMIYSVSRVFKYFHTYSLSQASICKRSTELGNVRMQSYQELFNFRHLSSMGSFSYIDIIIQTENRCLGPLLGRFDAPFMKKVCQIISLYNFLAINLLRICQGCLYPTTTTQHFKGCIEDDAWVPTVHRILQGCFKDAPKIH